MKAMLATKIGMTQLYDAEGRLQSVTVLQAGPCVVTQVKTVANDGDSAAQLGFGDAKRMPKSARFRPKTPSPFENRRDSRLSDAMRSSKRLGTT